MEDCLSSRNNYWGHQSLGHICFASRRRCLRYRKRRFPLKNCCRQFNRRSFARIMVMIWIERCRIAERTQEARVGNLLKFTVESYRTDGSVGFGYAPRLAGNVGNNFLSSTWPVPSEADWQDSLIRIAEGVGSKASSNAFAEFWPSVKSTRKSRDGNLRTESD